MQAINEPAGLERPAGSGTSAISSWSSPPVARITQAAHGVGARRLRMKAGEHHLLGAVVGSARRAAPGRTDRLDVHPEYVLSAPRRRAEEIAGGREP